MLGKFGALLIATVSIVGACSPRSFNNQGDVASQQNANGKIARDIAVSCYNPSSPFFASNHDMQHTDGTELKIFKSTNKPTIQVRNFFRTKPTETFSQADASASTTLNGTVLHSEALVMGYIGPDKSNPLGHFLEGATVAVDAKLFADGPGFEGEPPQNDPNYVEGKLTLSGPKIGNIQYKCIMSSR